MEDHSGFAAGKFSGKEGKDLLRQKWESLSHDLNAICGGAVKDSNQWQTVGFSYYSLIFLELGFVLEYFKIHWVLF